jgi:hypothetical protein
VDGKWAVSRCGFGDEIGAVGGLVVFAARATETGVIAAVVAAHADIGSTDDSFDSFRVREAAEPVRAEIGAPVDPTQPIQAPRKRPVQLFYLIHFVLRAQKPLWMTTPTAICYWR